MSVRQGRAEVAEGELGEVLLPGTHDRQQRLIVALRD